MACRGYMQGYLLHVGVFCPPRSLQTGAMAPRTPLSGLSRGCRGLAWGSWRGKRRLFSPKGGCTGVKRGAQVPHVPPEASKKGGHGVDFGGRTRRRKPKVALITPNSPIQAPTRSLWGAAKAAWRAKKASFAPLEGLDVGQRTRLGHRRWCSSARSERHQPQNRLQKRFERPNYRHERTETAPVPVQ